MHHLIDLLSSRHRRVKLFCSSSRCSIRALDPRFCSQIFASESEWECENRSQTETETEIDSAKRLQSPLAHSNEKSFRITMTVVHLLVLLCCFCYLQYSGAGASYPRSQQWDTGNVQTVIQSHLYSTAKAKCCFHSSIFIIIMLRFRQFGVVIFFVAFCILHSHNFQFVAIKW